MTRPARPTFVGGVRAPVRGGRERGAQTGAEGRGGGHEARRSDRAAVTWPAQAASAARAVATSLPGSSPIGRVFGVLWAKVAIPMFFSGALEALPVAPPCREASRDLARRLRGAKPRFVCTEHQPQPV